VGSTSVDLKHLYLEEVGSPSSTENASQSESMSAHNSQNEQAELATTPRATNQAETPRNINVQLFMAAAPGPVNQASVAAQAAPVPSNFEDYYAWLRTGPRSPAWSQTERALDDIDKALAQLRDLQTQGKVQLSDVKSNSWQDAPRLLLSKLADPNTDAYRQFLANGPAGNAWRTTRFPADPDPYHIVIYVGHLDRDNYLTRTFFQDRLLPIDAKTYIRDKTGKTSMNYTFRKFFPTVVMCTCGSKSLEASARQTRFRVIGARLEDHAPITPWARLSRTNHETSYAHTDMLTETARLFVAAAEKAKALYDNPDLEWEAVTKRPVRVDIVWGPQTYWPDQPEGLEPVRAG